MTLHLPATGPVPHNNGLFPSALLAIHPRQSGRVHVPQGSTDALRGRRRAHANTRDMASRSSSTTGRVLTRLPRSAPQVVEVPAPRLFGRLHAVAQNHRSRTERSVLSPLSLPGLPSLPSLPREMVHRPTGYLGPAVAGRTDLLRTWIQGGYRRDHRPPSRAGAHGAPPAVAGHPVQARGPAEVPPGHAIAVRAFSVRALPSGAPLQAQGAHTASSPGGAWRMARCRCRYRCASPVLGAGPDITGPAPEIRLQTSRMRKFGCRRWTSKSPHRPGTVRAP